MVFSGVCRGNLFCCFIQLLENRSWVVGRVCLLRLQRSLDNTLLSFALLHLYPKAKLAHYSRYLLTYYLCIPVPYDEKDIFFFFWCQIQKFLQVLIERSSSASPAFVVGAQTQITVILNDLSWQQSEIILSFLRLPPSAAFRTLLWTLKATSFLLVYSCPLKQI